MIKGKVMAMENGLLLIKLLDGSSLSAKVPDGFEASPGTLLTLQIGESIGEQLTARIVQMDIPQQADETNTQDNPMSRITRQLEALGVKATKDLVSKALGLLDENPGLGVEKAAFLAANGMESDPAMLEMAVKLANREFNLSDNLQTLRQMLADSLSGADRATLESLLKPVLLDLDAGQAVRDLAGRLADLHNAASGEDLALSEGAKLMLTRELLDALKGSITSGTPLNEGQVLDTLQRALSSLQSNKTLFPEGLNISDKQLKALIRDFIRTMEGIGQKTGELFHQEKPDTEKIMESIFDKAYLKLEDDEAPSVDMDEKFGTLRKILNLAADSTKLADGKGGQAIQPVVQELSKALQFFNQVSTYQVYVHIPLMIQQQQTVGELYIMKRGSRKTRIDPEQFTLFISLCTQNLGLVESFLNASHRCVTIHFRVESQQLADFVRAHHKELYEALGEKGYKLAEMKCRVLESSPVNLTNAAEKVASELGMNSRVDLRI